MDTIAPALEAPLPPHGVLGKYYNDPGERQGVVNSLFDDAARHYDRVTGLMSFGTGLAYRRGALRRAGVGPGSRVLDIACGTGQVSRAALSLVGPAGDVLGVDPSAGMRRVAQSRGLAAVEGTADHLPVADESVDVVVMGYALRHASDLHAAFREMRRVLRPGGVVLILEITAPETSLGRALLRVYLKWLVPPLTWLVTGSRRARELMSYYWDSIDRCVPPATIQRAMSDAGLVEVARNRSLGVFNEYTGRRSTVKN